MTGVQVRQMREGDLEAIIALQWALNLFENEISGDRATDRQSAAACVAGNLEQSRREGGATLVAEIDDQVIGYLSLAFADWDIFIREDVRRHGYVQDIVVAADHRGQGVAQALLGEAERVTRDAGLKALGLGVLAANRRAERAYRRFGFTPQTVEMVKTWS
jgi:GNAT superfamily N-acetyltransferase